MKVRVEGFGHFERIAEDIRSCKEDVEVYIEGGGSVESFKRGVEKLFGRKIETPPERKRLYDMYWNLVEGMCKKHGISLKDISFKELRRGLKRVVSGKDVVDVVRELEDYVTSLIRST